MDDRSPPQRSGPRLAAVAFRRTPSWPMAVAAVVLIGWALHALTAVLVPTMIALFVALVVAPLDSWAAERAGRRWIGHAAALVAILTAMLLFVASLWLAGSQAVARFPDGALESMAAQASDGGAPSGPQPAAAASLAESAAADAGGEAGQGAASGGLPWLPDGLGNFGGALESRLQDYASGAAASALRAIGAVLGAAAIVVFLALLMLIEARDWRAKLASTVEGGALRDVLDSVDVVAARLRRYLLARTALGAATGLLYAGWLWLFGIDLLLVWGLLAFLLNFIPTFGSLVAGVLPVLYAFMLKDPGTAVLVGAGILVIEQVMGNYVDPRVQGKQVSVSALVVLVALLLWSWIWGAAGAILAVPMTVALMIGFSHVEALRPVALMLSDERDMEGLDRMAGR